MALRWLEAGQACQHATIFDRVYDTVSGAIGSTYTDEFGRTAFDSATLLLRTFAVVPAVENTWVVGFGFQLTQSAQLNASPSAFPHIGLRNSVGEQLRIEAIDASDTRPGGNYYKMRVMRGATELARTNERFVGSGSAATYFEFKAVVRTSTNGSFSLRYHTRKGRATAFTATWSAANTGVNTANQGTDGADRLEFAWTTGDASDPMSLTDIYAVDSTSAKNNDFLGVLYMEMLKPDGTGTTNQWILAGSAASVEDAVNEPSATQSTGEDDKRVTSDTPGDLTLATMSNLSSKFGTTTLVGMQVRLYGKMETTGTRDVQFFYRKTTGTPAQIGTSILDLDTTAIVGEADTTQDDPNTAATYVLADLQAIQLGFELDA